MPALHIVLQGAFALLATPRLSGAPMLPSCARTGSLSLAVDPSVLQAVSVYDSEMEQTLLSLRDEIAALDARATTAETAASEAKAALDAKADEITKFVESVESELNSAREDIQRLTAELCVADTHPC